MTTKKRTIMLIDMQSFYASVEKYNYPQYKEMPLVVAGDPARRSGIILAACPLAKAYGVTTAEPLWQALQKCPDLVVVRPHMEQYIEFSMRIKRIIECYTDLVEPYSIDELFADVTGSLHLYDGDVLTLAQKIQDHILEKTTVFARLGIGENKVLSKLACDLIAKKTPKGIFVLHKDAMHQHIGSKPIRDMWGIGSRMEKHLWKMGIRTIAQLAQTPLGKLRKRWGVNGEVIWRVANGIDDSPVSRHSHDVQKDIGNAMTLPKDYTRPEDIEIVIQELCTEVCRRARRKAVAGSTVSLGITGADFSHPTGFHRQLKLHDPTNLTQEVYEAARKLFYIHWDQQAVRRVSVSLSGLMSDKVCQLTLFDNKEHWRAVDQVMDQIKDRYGEIAILRASCLMPAAQAMDRSEKVGGHYK